MQKNKAYRELEKEATSLIPGTKKERKKGNKKD